MTQHPKFITLHELVADHANEYDNIWYSSNTWKARFALWNVQEAVKDFSFETKTHTFPEIRTALETESGIQGITVPSISIDASPDVDGKALVAAGFTEKSGKFWLTDSEKITRWSEKTYGLPASLPSDAPFDPSHLLKIGFILRPVTDLFLPPGEAREYMTKKKFGPPPAWENIVKSAQEPQAKAAAVETFDALESRLASQPYLNGSKPSFEDYALFGFFSQYYQFSSLNIGQAPAYYEQFWTGGKYPQLLEWKERLWNGWEGQPGKTLKEGVAAARAGGQFK